MSENQRVEAAQDGGQQAPVLETISTTDLETCFTESMTTPSDEIEGGTCANCGQPIQRRLLQEVDDLTGKRLAYAWWHAELASRYCAEFGGVEAAPAECTGETYVVNPDAPEEGTDIHHDGPCLVHGVADHHVTITEGGGLYFLHCPTCGNVGGAQEWMGDAEAIADRHEKLGGFER